MKTILYTLTILFVSITARSQEFEYLKKLDTIYIEFKGKKNEKKHSIQTRNAPQNFDERLYSFSLKKTLIRLNFEHWKFINWEKKEANVVSEVRKVDKLFLRKHKREIIKICYLEKYNYDEIVCELFSPLKVFYIIDFTEKIKGNVVLYEVICINSCPVYE
ncbi:hypothetical protein [Flavobacterium hydrophilum]|nr:hypothetical protein [Flavobacterium hydrophilum]